MKFRAIALAGAASLALTAPALAQQAGWYLGLGLGVDQLMPVAITVSPPTNTGTLGYDLGAIALLSGGYKFEDGFRIEAEAGGDWHNARKLTGALAGSLASVSGGTSTLSGFVNLMYDFQVSERWALSLGGGFGMADVNHYEDSCPFLGSCGKFIAGAHWSWAWQVIGGVDYAIDDSVALFADYRFRSLHVDHDFDAIINPIEHVGRQQENVGLFGIRWYFDTETPPSPPQPPLPPPPPSPPPPPVKTFIVFFDFDKANLTAKAQDVVAEAVRTAKANGLVKVVVTGHTDTVGSDRFNQALSLRRADAVKDEMVREGMDGSGIAIVGKGFHDPLVQTGPDVREPQNRRAVIDLGG